MLNLIQHLYNPCIYLPQIPGQARNDVYLQNFLTKFANLLGCFLTKFANVLDLLYQSIKGTKKSPAGIVGGAAGRVMDKAMPNVISGNQIRQLFLYKIPSC